MSAQRQKHLYDYEIDGFGNWFCEGNPVTDPEVFRLLSRSLFQRGGRTFVQCEGEVHPVRVADAPLWIHCVHIHFDAQGNPARVELELRDGRRETLDPQTLTLAHERALYCVATGRRLRARFDKIAYYELARYIEMNERGAFFLKLAGRRHAIVPEPEPPPSTSEDQPA